MSPEDARQELTSRRHGFAAETLDIWLRADGRCEYCGVDVTSSGSLYFHGYHLDHIDPDGGEGLENKALACVVCNIRKRSYKPQGGTRDDRVRDAGQYIRALRERDAGRLAEALPLLADYGLERARNIQPTP